MTSWSWSWQPWCKPVMENYNALHSKCQKSMKTTKHQTLFQLRLSFLACIVQQGTLIITVRHVKEVTIVYFNMVYIWIVWAESLKLQVKTERHNCQFRVLPDPKLMGHLKLHNRKGQKHEDKQWMQGLFSNDAMWTIDIIYQKNQKCHDNCDYLDWKYVEEINFRNVNSGNIL
jgi:hypothetical protein